jgi:hypothetical protein
MTTNDEIRRRIELKEQLIEITQAEIRELRKELNISRGTGYVRTSGD